MRNFKSSKFALAAIASFSMLVVPGRSWAGEQVSTSDSAGTFSQSPFRFSVSVRGGYDDNVNTTAFDEKSSAFVSVGGTLAYNFGSPRTKVSLVAGGGYTYYLNDVSNDVSNNNGDNYDANAYLSLSITHKATPRLTLAASVYASYQTQPDFSLSIGLNRRSGSFFYTSDKFSLAYLWTPRFSTVTSYTIGALKYSDSNIGAFEDRVENTLGNEFRFLVLPTTSLIAEYRLGFVNYDTGNGRDSITHYALAGIDHSFSPRLNISLRGGAEFREYDNNFNNNFNNDNGNSTNPYFEGTLLYALGKQTSISWTSRYALEEPDVANALSRTTFRTGLSLRHYFTQKFSTSVAVFYEHDENDAFQQSFFFRTPAFSEDSVDLVLSARYAITRCLALEAGYNFTDVQSDIALREYTRNRFWGGLNFSF